MSAGAHLWAWATHAAMNLGAALCCLWHTVIPPQYDHDTETIKSLSQGSPLREFLVSLDDTPPAAVVALVVAAVVVMVLR